MTNQASPTIILAEPEHPGNIGAICRVMANFGAKDLVLINPKTEITQEAHNLAKNAQSILNNARIADWKVLSEFRVVAATAGIRTSDLNMHRSPLTPRQAAEKLAGGKGVALLFGRERNGLTNAELAKADFVITIPTTSEYTSMNLSHAVAVMLYECYLLHGAASFAPIPAKRKQVLFDKMDAFLTELEFPTEGKRNTQKKIWKNILGRTIFSAAEAQACLGFFRAIEKRQNQLPTNATQPKLRKRVSRK